MTPQQLRNSILQLAMQGKLVDQRQEDGTGEELFEQIQSEKNRLIKEGKIKKDKSLPEIEEKEIPFDIPENWKWVRVSDICAIINGDRGKAYPAKSTLSHEGIPFISALNLNGKSVTVDENLLCMSDSQYEQLRAGKLQQNDIVVCIRGSLGKHGRFQLEKGAIASSLVICRLYKGDESTAQFFMKYLDCPLFFSEIKEYDNGTAQPNLAAKSFEKFLFPLPPLAEQKRIVEKLEELMPLVDRYEEAWTKLEAFNARFPVDMQNSILQMAMEGKLVEQRPEEGTGEELYQQVQEEKKRLIKEGIIKKEKPLPEIEEKEIPYDIPETWRWVRIGSFASVLGGKRIPAGRTLTKENTGHVYIRVTDMKDGCVSTDDLHYVPEDIYPTISKYIINKEDIFITVAGTIGRVGKISAELDGANLTENADRLVFRLIDQNWLIKCMQSLVVQSQIAEATTKSSQPKLAIFRIQKMLIPLPPLAEQKRIVAKLEELLPLCERLKS